jgi:hypothetical protein
MSVIRYFIFLICTCFMLFICNRASASEQAAGKHTISGFVYEKGSRESLIGATIYVPGLRAGTTTNNYGFYSITLPADSMELIFSFVGYQPVVKKILLSANLQLDVELNPSVEIAGVEIREDRIERISQAVQMSHIHIPVSHTKSIPALLGEKDVFKVIQLLPGVQSGQEGNSGFYVRGGGADQNLIILDDAIVYNASHLFGFFSIFNGDAVKNIQLYKGGFPARFGGRLSSVLDISMKDGNKEKISGEAGIGIVSSRLTLEGPIIKDKASFLFSGRRTYIDALIMPFMPEDEKGGYYFYDLNAKVHYEHDRRNKFYASGYFGRDKFFFQNKAGSHSREEAGLFWQNTTATLRWNHLFNDRLFANASLIYSDYTLKIYMDERYYGQRLNLSYASGIQDLGTKYDLTWHPSPSHLIRAGFQTTWHQFTPSALVLKDDFINEYISDIQSIHVLESGLYAEDEIRIGDRMKLNPGFRLSHFVHSDKHYLKPEPRLSVLYLILPDLAWKTSYASMNQYVHLLSHTGVGLPTDLWVPTTKNIPPQSTWQVATGLSKDFLAKGLELSAETYYKKSNNTIGYREGASFLLIDDPSEAEAFSWEDNITSGEAWSYGLELFLQKKTGRLSGWIGYTLSWTRLRFDEVNVGKTFWARHDRRHDLSLVGMYEVHPGFSLSATWVYASGNALTLPNGEYARVTHNPWGEAGYYHEQGFSGAGTPFSMMPWNSISDYGNKNDFRSAPYHRLDVGMQFKKAVTRFGAAVDRTIELSAYNLYNRKNPFFYFIENDWEGGSHLKQVSLFPIIPSISVSYSF